MQCCAAAAAAAAKSLQSCLTLCNSIDGSCLLRVSTFEEYFIRLFKSQNHKVT